jgi:hypothetical protein
LSSKRDKWGENKQIFPLLIYLLWYLRKWRSIEDLDKPLFLVILYLHPSEAVLTNRLKEIEKLINQFNSELLDDSEMYQQWEEAQRNLEKIHQKCAVMREKLNDPNYEPNYREKRDLIEFFGITATIWETGHKPRYTIGFNLPQIESSHQ